MYVLKVCLIHRDDKKISFGQNKHTKNALSFLSRSPTHHSFFFNLRFLNELKHKVSLSKTVGFSIFDYVSFLLKLFLFNKMHRLFNFETL